MLENVKEAISELVEKELEDRKQRILLQRPQVLKKYDLLPNGIHRLINETEVDIDIINKLCKTPNLEFVQYDMFGEDEINDYTEGFFYKVWLSEDLKSGIIAGSWIEGEYDASDLESYEVFGFHIHKVGKNGRNIQTRACLFDKKAFIEKIDDFVVDMILLEEDDVC